MMDRRDARAGDNLPAAFSHSLRQALADFRVIDDAGLGDMNGGDAGYVRFKLAQPILTDALAPDAVRLAALQDTLQRRQLVVVDGDDHLAANLQRNPLVSAES